MTGRVSIGTQNFEKLRESNSFYVDKTDFIRQWWENGDDVTLITRPRRFGKTLNMSMMECFFSVKYVERGDLFKGLTVWDDSRYRELQGTWPVVSLSFAGVKAKNFQGAKDGIINAIANAYNVHSYLKYSNVLTEEEKSNFDAFRDYMADPSENKEMADSLVVTAIQKLSFYLEQYYGKKVLIFLDGYDTPLQEAYVSSYWSELTALIRSLFNSSFKTNSYLYRALLTGITRVSKESIFSDLNNLKVVTTTDRYSTAFGFTEEEVFRALEERNLAGEIEGIRFWYDGFVFGSRAGIYNPWSITMFLDTGEYGAYWADTSSNILVSELIRTGTPELKMQMEELLTGGCIEIDLDEQVIFEQLKKKKGAIWSLLLASGYLKPQVRTFSQEKSKFVYKLKLTNHEVEMMFRDMIAGWFPEDETAYGNFREALLADDLDYMNQYMNEVAQEMFSSFDVGRKASAKKQPERFYHGFVLGLIVDLAGRYRIRSNRESGLGRYDTCRKEGPIEDGRIPCDLRAHQRTSIYVMEPVRETDDAIIIEFKVFFRQKDKTPAQAVKSALKQIEDKGYDAELMARGIPEERIRHYGFVFDGKKVLIGRQTKVFEKQGKA